MAIKLEGGKALMAWLLVEELFLRLPLEKPQEGRKKFLMAVPLRPYPPPQPSSLMTVRTFATNKKYKISPLLMALSLRK